jgi:hypothetical protein
MAASTVRPPRHLLDQLALHEKELAKIEAGRLHERSPFQAQRRDALKASIERLRLAVNPNS